ncbi:GMC family oxidoreductase [Mesorhizobium sp. AR07]|uniref:GMC family oxidoreductase n=1 Tax=Mesorhizobium sp. AR07 TaxID=2865838 RepID=UPI00215F61AF|nr:GMC family oxidoreductase [Mesorhizobium sp. AR07]UVK43812.1 GMC family oxidoreductase [Mesorhizobium sp. AR07]
MNPAFDAIVVGSGAAGGIVACVLAEGGKTVLLIERGKERRYDNSGYRDHLRNHRLSRYGHNTGPDIEGNPRVFVDAQGNSHVVRPHEANYHANASALGSGTTVYGGLAWRFHPDDFRMASRYGVPERSSLVDWPFDYSELEPWYERAEHEIGVSGQGGQNPQEGIRNRDYPMPPVPGNPGTDVLRKGADALGLNTFVPPLLINTVPRLGRKACIQCGSCVGFMCPTDAKNGTQNTMIPRAVATGRCTVLAQTTVDRIATDAEGKVVGVYVVALNADGNLKRDFISARTVVLSAGAIETARLLLLSKTDKEPHGLGNSGDLVGRNLQGHIYPIVFGLFDHAVQDSKGPGVTIATCDYNHGNEGVIGGAMLADDFVMLPVIFWKAALPPGLPRYGLEAKRFMRTNFRRVTQIKGPVQEIPSPGSRVTLDEHCRDLFGRRVARLSGSIHDETKKTAAYIHGKADEWLRASGALKTWGAPPSPQLSGGQHQAGTCRMGDRPENSVTDAFGKVWGHENLFVCDGSLHPTNGGYNPVLTIMALAFRNATHIANTI